MTLYYNYDIRAATLGINLKDCIDSDLEKFKENVYEKIVGKAKQLVKEASSLEKKYGVPIINRRISVTPISIIAETIDEKGLLEIAKTLDRAAKDAGIDFIGGYGAHVQKGMTKSDLRLINSLPEVLSQTERVCCFLNVGTNISGLNMDAVILASEKIKEIAKVTHNSIGCAKLVVFANVPEDSPFMAGAFHGIGEGDYALNIGISGPGVVKNIVEKHPDCDLGELSEIIKKTAFKITRAGELIGRDLAKKIDVPFGIVDLSLASTPTVGDSVGEILEVMGLERVGTHGSTAAVALLIDAIKRGGAMASSSVGGLSGTFIPVTEDLAMARAAKEGVLSIAKLESLSAVCSVGLDMFVIPGDTPMETIAAIIADELAIGVVQNKTTGVRVIPATGKKAGDWVDFGGLLGKGPVMEVLKPSPAKFINRGGRLPAPVTSLRN